MLRIRTFFVYGGGTYKSSMIKLMLNIWLFLDLANG
jgi:hypothetical protein